MTADELRTMRVIADLLRRAAAKVNAPRYDLGAVVDEAIQIAIEDGVRLSFVEPRPRHPLGNPRLTLNGRTPEAEKRLREAQGR